MVVRTAATTCYTTDAGAHNPHPVFLQDAHSLRLVTVGRRPNEAAASWQDSRTNNASTEAWEMMQPQVQRRNARVPVGWHGVSDGDIGDLAGAVNTCGPNLETAAL
jgi:hypothetical protein